jgi:hypothetical protein
VPVTHGGRLTPEAKEYLAFVEELMRLWAGARQNRGRTLFACPEMGPYTGFGDGGGYNITGLRSGWPEAVALRGELARVWRRATR